MAYIDQYRKELIKFLKKISAGEYEERYFDGWSNKDLVETIKSKLDIYLNEEK